MILSSINYVIFFSQSGIPNNKYQIHLKSNNGSICVLLVNRDSPQDQPVVVTVPPSDYQKETDKSADTQKNNGNNNKHKEKVKKGEQIETDSTSMHFVAILYSYSVKKFNFSSIFANINDFVS